MTPMQVATLLIRLTALAWALIAFNSTYTIIVQWSAEPYSSVSIPGYWFYIVLHFGICSLLWLFPTAIARKLVPSLAAAPESQPAPSTAYFQWQTIGVVCIGLWVLTRAIPDLLYWISSALWARAYQMESLDVLDKGAVIATVAELAIGLWLVLGAQGLAEVLFRIRNVGMRERGAGDQTGQS